MPTRIYLKDIYINKNKFNQICQSNFLIHSYFSVVSLFFSANRVLKPILKRNLRVYIRTLVLFIIYGWIFHMIFLNFKISFRFKKELHYAFFPNLSNFTRTSVSVSDISTGLCSNTNFTAEKISN